MLTTIRNLLLYGGLTKEEFNSISLDVCAQNLKSVRIYTTITSLMLGVITIIAFFTDTFASVNSLLYLGCFLLSAAIRLCSKAGENREVVTKVFKYLFIVLVYLFAIALSSLHSEAPSVTFIVVMVIVPLLFAGKPIWMIVVTFVAMGVNVAIAFCFKNPEWIIPDIWNTLSFGLLAMIVGIFIIQMRLKSFMQVRKIAELSESDLLTGVKNRNSFEQNLALYEKGNIEGLACVYADVNGLHEVNNTRGHHAGDVMLKTVAGEILKQFGREHSYRIGGDEFVMFSFDQTKDQVDEKISQIIQACQAEGYQVSFGCAQGQKEEGNLDSLIKAAEEKMYQAKAEYYRSSKIDRRSR